MESQGHMLERVQSAQTNKAQRVFLELWPKQRFGPRSGQKCPQTRTYGVAKPQGISAQPDITYKAQGFPLELWPAQRLEMSQTQIYGLRRPQLSVAAGRSNYYARDQISYNVPIARFGQGRTLLNFDKRDQVPEKELKKFKIDFRIAITLESGVADP